MKFLEGKKTYFGILIAAIPVVSGVFGFDITPDNASEIGGIVGDIAKNITSVITSVGLLVAMYGRKKAK